MRLSLRFSPCAGLFYSTFLAHFVINQQSVLGQVPQGGVSILMRKKSTFGCSAWVETSLISTDVNLEQKKEIC